MNITIHRNGENYGPYTLDQVKQYVGNGSLSESDLAWYEGCMDWLPLKDVITPVTTPPPPPRLPSPAVSQKIEPTASSTVQPSTTHSSQFTGKGYSPDTTNPISKENAINAPDRQPTKRRMIGVIVGIVVFIGVFSLCLLNYQPVAVSSHHLQSSSANQSGSIATSSSVDQSRLPDTVPQVMFDANSSNTVIYDKIKDKIIFTLRYFPQHRDAMEDGVYETRRDLVGYTCVASGCLKLDNNGDGLSITFDDASKPFLSFKYNIIKNDDGRGNATTTDSLTCSCDDNTDDDGLVFVNGGSLETRPRQDSFGNYLHFIVVENPSLESIGTTVEIADTTKVSLSFSETEDVAFRRGNEMQDDARGYGSDVVWADSTYPKQADKSEWGNFVPRNGDLGKVVSVGTEIAGDGFNKSVLLIYCVAIDTPVKTYYVNVIASGLTVKSRPPKTLNATDSTTSTVTPDSSTVSHPPAQAESTAASSDTDKTQKFAGSWHAVFQTNTGVYTYNIKSDGKNIHVESWEAKDDNPTSSDDALKMVPYSSNSNVLIASFTVLSEKRRLTRALISEGTMKLLFLPENETIAYVLEDGLIPFNKNGLATPLSQIAHMGGDSSAPTQASTPPAPSDSTKDTIPASQPISRTAKLVEWYRSQSDSKRLFALYDDNTYSCDDPKGMTNKVYGTYNRGVDGGNSIIFNATSGGVQEGIVTDKGLEFEGGTTVFVKVNDSVPPFNGSP